MRYMTYGYFHPNFLRLTLLSLLVSLSPPESAVSSDALGLGAPLAPTAQPTLVLWPLDHFLASTDDAMEAFLVNVSGTAIKITSSSGSGQSSCNKQTPQNDERSW